MKKRLLNFLILLLSINLHCQNQLNEEDWIAILSGNIESYQKYDIKSIALINHSNIELTSIIHDADENTLTIKNRENQYQYKYDEFNRIINVVSENQSHLLSYFDSVNTINSYKIRLAKDSSVFSQTIRLPYKDYPKIKWVETLETKLNDTIHFDTIKRVLNFKDSLNGYYENGSNNGYSRYYFSGDKEHFHKNSNTYIYESFRTNPDGKVIGEKRTVKGDSILKTTYKADTIYDAYLKNDKLYKLVIYGNNSNSHLYSVHIYDSDNQKLLESKKYTYFPFNNTGNLGLWEIKTIDHLNNKVSKEYPYKKAYRLKNHQLFEKRRRKKEKEESKFYSICKTEEYKPNYENLITSTSILIDLDRLNGSLYDMDPEDYYYSDQCYIHSTFQLEHDAEPKFKILVSIDNQFITNEIESELSSLIKKEKTRLRYRMHNSLIEVTTNDGKKWIVEPMEYLDKLNLNLDLFMFRD